MSSSVLETITEQVTSAFGSSWTARGQLIHLPLDLRDGDVVSVHVEQLDSDHYLLSDLGDSAARLSLAGVEFGREVVLRSWKEVRRSARLAPAVFGPSDPDEFEITTTCSAADLGTASMQLGAAMLRAEGLVALAPGYRPKTFAARVVRRVSDFDLTVIPEAEMPLQFGGARRVTCEIKSSSQEVFTQALSRAGDRSRAYDHVRALFTDASEHLTQEQKVIVIQDGLQLPSWQRETLVRDNLVVHEEILDKYLESLVA